MPGSATNWSLVAVLRSSGSTFAFFSVAFASVVAGFRAVASAFLAVAAGVCLVAGVV